MVGARRELEGGRAGSWQGGFHRWSVLGVATVLVRGAKTDPRGWAVVVEAGQGLEGVAGDGVVVPWEIEPWVSSVDKCGGPRELESMSVKVLCLLVKVWKCC